MSKPAMRYAAIILLLVTVLAGPGRAQELLDIVPDQAVFCFRINDLDRTTSTLDSFASAIGPVPISLLVRMQLAAVLGDPSLAYVDTAGGFGVFALAPDEPNFQDPFAPGAQGFSAILLPITNYGSFVSQNPGISSADGDGISTLAVDIGDLMSGFGAMAGPGDFGDFDDFDDFEDMGQDFGQMDYGDFDMPGNGMNLIIAQLGDYAIITESTGRDKLLELTEAEQNGPALSRKLPSRAVRRSASEPVWMYFNIEAVREVIEAQAHALPGELTLDMGLDPAILTAVENLQYLTFALRPARTSLTLNLSLAGSNLGEIEDMVTAMMFLIGPGSETDRQNAAALLPQAVNNDILGTVNLLELMAGQMPREAAADDMNYIAYTMRAHQDSLDFEAAIPQQHFVELVEMAMTMGETITFDQDGFEFDADLEFDVEFEQHHSTAEPADLDTQPEPEAEPEPEKPESYQQLESFRQQHAQQMEDFDENLREDQQRRQQRLEQLQQQLQD